MSAASTSGREPIVYVEIDQDFCERTYGVAPCLASAATGPTRCYNTLATCQWRSAWARGTKTLRFTDRQDAPDPLAIPSVVSVETAPTAINPGGAGSRSGPLGQRASVSITFQDHPDTDALTDPYYSVRALGNAQVWRERGTFWTRWLARNPYHVNRVVRIRTGYRGQELHEFTTRTYLIDRIDGPDSSGRVTLRAKDILRLADDDKAVAPRPSPGVLMEDYDQDDAITHLRVTGADASEYSGGAIVRVGRELFRITFVTTISPTEIQLSVAPRAYLGTEAQSHKAGDRVQRCVYFPLGQPVYWIVYHLLTDYASIPAAYIPLADWVAEDTAWLSLFTLEALITEPTGVRQLLAELAEQCQFLLWWDERTQRIRFEAFKPLDGQAVAHFNDDEHIVADSVRMRADPSSRASQVWVFYGVADPTARLDDDTNYRHILVRADLDAESADQYGEPSIYKIHSRWLTTEGQALNAATRILDRRRDPPRTVTLEADAKDADTWTGDVVDVTHRGIVDFNGLPVTTRFQITSAEDVALGHRVRYELQSYTFALGVRSAFWMADAAPDYSSASPTEKARGAWWADEDGTVGGDPGYNWV